LLVATPADESYRGGTEWQAPTALAGGLAFTMLAAIYIVFLLNRTHLVARLVGQRTSELVLSNEGLVTEARTRKEAQDHLARSEHRIRTIIDAVTDGIITLSPDGTVETVNRAACMMFGRAPQEITGHDLRTLIADGSKLPPLSAGETTAERGSIGAEVKGQRRNGTTFAMEVSFTDMRLDNEIKHIATLRDITERKKIDRLKNEFVSTVSHELRTPLTSINGALGLIDGGLAGEIPEKASELIEVARRNGDRLVRLINDILDIEKIESGEMEINFQPLPIMDVIERAVRANGGFASQFGVEVRIKESLPGAEVYAGEDQFMQILTNLISNAVKFSPLGGAVELAVTRTDHSLRVSVTDHGPGIDTEFQPRLFGKFSQADSSDTRRPGGTGLGLNICRGLVEMHGGQIDFTTETGEGTTFYFDLPEWNAAQQDERGAA
jgi:PAS domain S-box-containing protein